jgi:phosphomannomutase
VFFAFDVDGTLTPSRQRVDPNFEQWFIDWMSIVQGKGHSVLLVTGSDYDKTVEQLGSAITESVNYCCNCLGNHVLHKGQLIESYTFEPSSDLIRFLESELWKSYRASR